MSYNGTRRQVGAKLKLSAADGQSDTGGCIYAVSVAPILVTNTAPGLTATGILAHS